VWIGPDAPEKKLPMPSFARRLRSAVWIARQLRAHQGFLLRKAAQESAGLIELAAAAAVDKIAEALPILAAQTPLRDLEVALLQRSERDCDALLHTAARLGDAAAATGKADTAALAWGRAVERMRTRQTEQIVPKLLVRLTRATGKGKAWGARLSQSDAVAFERSLRALQSVGRLAPVRQTPWRSPAELWAEAGWLTPEAWALARKSLHAKANEDPAPVDALRSWLLQDPDDAWAWRRLAEGLGDGPEELDDSEAALRRALELEPLDDKVWQLLGDRLARRSTLDRPRTRSQREFLSQARAAHARAAQLNPLNANAFWASRGLDVRHVTDLGGAGPVTVERVTDEAGADRPLRLRPGETRRVTWEISLRQPVGRFDSGLAEPFGLGFTGRVVEAPQGPWLTGQRVTVEVEVTGHRPDFATGVANQGWRGALQLRLDGVAVVVPLEVSVAATQPGDMLWIVTEDHELHEHDLEITPQAARRTLVDVSRYAEQLASQRQIPWTHMLDAGSALALLAWAAEQARAAGRLDSAWISLHRDSTDALADGVAAGHDLGIHLHAFNTPTCANFAYAYDAERDLLYCSDRFLLAAGAERGYFAKAFARLGQADEPMSRVGELLNAIEQIEAVGRLGRPGFQALLFRSGSFEMAATPGDDVRSLQALRRLGVPADSSWPKPSLYGQGPAMNPLRASRQGHREHAQGPADHGTVEIRSEYNIEGDYLADAATLRAYLDRRVAGLKSADGAVRPGVHVVCAMTHDKYIGTRMGRSPLPLLPDQGDWATVDQHLADVNRRRPTLQPVTASEAVRRWLDANSPEPVVVRCDEILIANSPDATEEGFRIVFEWLGRDIPIDADHPATVDLRVPTWLRRQVLRAEARVDGRTVAAWTEPRLLQQLRPLPVTVTTRPESLELVVTCARAERLLGCEWVQDGQMLRADLPFRCATVALPDGRILRKVRFAADGHGQFVAPAQS
jgi:hypothetical protein